MIKFLDLHKVNQRFTTDFKNEFESFLNSGHYILGDAVKKFEQQFADYCGTAHSIGVASGLDALILILRGYKTLNVLQDNDEVLVPSNTYIATILAIIEAGLKPVLVEPIIDTYNIDPNQVKRHLTSKTKAIMVVHLYGQLADMSAVNDLANEHDLLVIEDAAQAHGAISQTGKKAGNLSDAAAFSFYPSKNLGALGDGGMITTNNEVLANTIRKIRNYGTSSKYVNEIKGVNSRLDAIQARFLSVKLPFLNVDNESRRHVAQQYLSGIQNDKVLLPFYNGSNNHVFHLFVIRVTNRDHFMQYLEEKGVQTLIHYPIPPHEQQALVDMFKGGYPISDKIHQEVLSLPISPVMTDQEVKLVINLINQY